MLDCLAGLLMVLLGLLRRPQSGFGGAGLPFSLF